MDAFGFVLLVSFPCEIPETTRFFGVRVLSEEPRA